jgi:hypothetical protein
MSMATETLRFSAAAFSAVPIAQAASESKCLNCSRFSCSKIFSKSCSMLIVFPLGEKGIAWNLLLRDSVS